MGQPSGDRLPPWREVSDRPKDLESWVADFADEVESCCLLCRDRSLSVLRKRGSQLLPAGLSRSFRRLRAASPASLMSVSPLSLAARMVRWIWWGSRCDSADANAE